MHLIDTHCHLNSDQFSQRWQEVVQQSIQQGVGRFFVVGWDELSSRQAVTIAIQEPKVKAIVGLHPVDVSLTYDLTFIHSLVQQHQDKIIAIGEIGLDYHWKKDPKDHELQARVFVEQIDLANQLNLPVVIHCRDAYEAILPILESHPVKQGGVMHCYAGPSHIVERFIALGFYLSYGGPITYKNADEARQSVSKTPIDRLLIETDSPFLSPHPLRGKQNSPINLPIIFDKLKMLTQLPTDQLTKQLYDNTLKAFHVKTL